MGAGNVPSTYGAATAGFDEKTKARFNRRVNEYQLNYYADHGHYASEPDAVKHALMGATAEEAWRSILPLPVVPDYQPSSEQKLVQQFMSLVDPNKRRDFLDKHPGFSDHFGIYTDPKVYLHNHEFFGRFLTAVDVMRAARAEVLTQAKTDGFTPDLLLKNLAPARLQLLRVWIRLRVGRIGEQRQFLLELLLGIAVDLGVVLGLQLREESVKDMLRVDLRVGRRELAPRAKGTPATPGI